MRRPASLLQLDLAQWDQLLPLARRQHLLARFLPQLQRLQLVERLPAPVLSHFQAAALTAAQHRRQVVWEVNRIERVLGAVIEPIVLLKGAAYVQAGLACAEGRLSSDVDILVARGQLASAEQTLLANGWLAVVEDDYDQQYYRRWAHELPPLRHRLRGTVIDVHHSILPLTSRLTPDPQLLLEAARPLPGSRCRVLAPPDMVLHSAVHGFFDGDFSNMLRDLVDLHELLTEFAAEPQFWPALRQRAVQLGLQRPLFYALRFCRRYLGTDIHPDLRLPAPPAAAARLMDGLADQALFAARADSAAHWLLYVRSHWLRMPPLLLAGHLLRKGGRRLRLPGAQG